jgi:hypothetical protein
MRAVIFRSSVWTINYQLQVRVSLIIIGRNCNDLEATTVGDLDNWIYIDDLQVVTTYNYNIIADFHATYHYTLILSLLSLAVSW